MWASVERFHGAGWNCRWAGSGNERSGLLWLWAVERGGANTHVSGEREFSPLSSAHMLWFRFWHPKAQQYISSLFLWVFSRLLPCVSATTMRAQLRVTWLWRLHEIGLYRTASSVFWLVVGVLLCSCCSAVDCYQGVAVLFLMCF